MFKSEILGSHFIGSNAFVISCGLKFYGSLTAETRKSITYTVFFFDKRLRKDDFVRAGKSLGY